MKLLGLILGSFVVFGIGLATVHFFGLGQNYREFENQFFKSKNPWIITSWEQNFFLEKEPNLVLLANVYQASSGILLVAPSNEKVFKNKDREQNPSPVRPLLKDLLAQFPQARFILHITDNIENIDRRVAAALENESRSERIMIHSDYNMVLQSIKALLPMFVFGSTPSDIMRFKSFQSMGILTVTPFKGDVYFTSLRIKDREAINEDIAKELRRRHKKIILGPLTNPDEFNLALRLGAHGLFVEKPESLLQWLSQNPH